MRELAHILLHQPNSLTPGERELIATYVSSRKLHDVLRVEPRSRSRDHLGDASVVEKVKADFVAAPISPKLKALLAIAGKVQQDGKLVTECRRAGRTHAGRHRPRNSRHGAYRCSVLHVQPLRRWLGTMAADKSGMYAQMGKHLAEEGYTTPSIRQPVGSL